MASKEVHSVSVVIPVRNGRATIEQCLEAIFASTIPLCEVIVVDDSSSDDTIDLVSHFPCRIIKNIARTGRGASKNKGFEAAKGQLVAFIDADVLVHPDTIEKALAAFVDDPYLSALCAVPEADSLYPNFASRYKSYYMHYILMGFSAPTDFLHGCFQVFRKDVLESRALRFDEKLHCDDIDLGIRLKKKGGKILVLRQAPVVHKRYYSLLGLLRNDFMVSAEFAQLLCKHALAVASLKQGRFAHARLRQLTSVCTVGASIGAMALPYPAVLSVFAFITLFLLLNYSFFQFLQRLQSRGEIVKSIVFTFIDQMVMLSGILFGAFGSLIRRKDSD
jgi:cellulose synthase/poly-beta-1,6-N-acetylglucosamine synthase-like glycosyltransferase